ncbi:tryptophanase [Lentzea cavernae]|uniref:Tryptophanase n=1 Tax=Lentzea cavernae TaxID=2020703 RepID=A0ABQ3MRF3_9PSEU|nr:tryptophanase [Lentzea cavernae]GHH56420.1 tryptophanase [Lentzea cavernae]
MLMEPYRIKVVEPITLTDRPEREKFMAAAGYNPFNLRAEQVMIDLLTDSGTGALSAEQVAAGTRGDETYAGSPSFYRFRAEIEDLTSYPHIFPVHQGRAAERILFAATLKPGQMSLSNTHFDTTRANVELLGCEARDIPCEEARDIRSAHPFKGNIDLAALELFLRWGNVGQVIMTVTNNGGGGQPVSIENIRRAAEICRTHGVLFFLDAARFAENAWLVSQNEREFAGHSPRSVAREMFALADGCVASLKKDGIVHMGGVIALRDAGLAARCEQALIAGEGFSTYGGLSGRDLDMLAQGLREGTDAAYLRGRAAATAHLAGLLTDAGVPVVRPPGVHAVYIDAGAVLPHLPPELFPAHSFATELYLEGGVRAVEIGSLMCGTVDEHGVLVKPAPRELVRLALPRRVYTQSHLEYVAETAASVMKHVSELPGYRLVESPEVLRHFKCRLEPVAQSPRPVGQVDRGSLDVEFHREGFADPSDVVEDGFAVHAEGVGRRGR